MSIHAPTSDMLPHCGNRRFVPITEVGLTKNRTALLSAITWIKIWALPASKNRNLQNIDFAAVERRNARYRVVSDLAFTVAATG